MFMSVSSFIFGHLTNSMRYETKKWLKVAGIVVTGLLVLLASNLFAWTATNLPDAYDGMSLWYGFLSAIFLFSGIGFFFLAVTKAFDD